MMNAVPGVKLTKFSLLPRGRLRPREAGFALAMG